MPWNNSRSMQQGDAWRSNLGEQVTRVGRRSQTSTGRVDDRNILARAQWTIDKSRLLREECVSRGQDAFGLRLGAQQAVIDTMLLWDQVLRQQEMWKRTHQNPELRRKAIVDLNAWRQSRQPIASAG